MTLSIKFDQILKNYLDIENELAGNLGDDPKKYAKLSKQFSDLGELVSKIKDFKKYKKELEDLDTLLVSDDSDMKDFAFIEKEKLQNDILVLEGEIKVLLIPKDESDEKNAIIEIRAGTGGEEAALFAADLLRMYSKFSDILNWKNEIIDISETDHDGIKEVILGVSGKDVFGTLKYESGTHRVQRVPETESGGRIHTSAATVAVFERGAA